MFNIKKRFEIKLNNYYSEKLVDLIKHYVISRFNLDIKIEERNKTHILIDIKKRKYNDNQWQTLFSFKKTDAITYLFKQDALYKEIIESVEKYCNKY